MTAGQIINLLLAGRYRRNFCIPNYTPRGWWECDVFELTKAGYFTEYEVKVTRSDFAADVRKERKVWEMGVPLENRRAEAKHQLLRQCDRRGPSRFFYVVPWSLGITPQDVPAYAGLIWIGDEGKRLFEQPQKPAPRLHRTPCHPAVEPHAQSVCYWRMHTALSRLVKHAQKGG